MATEPRDLTETEMGTILLAHGTAEMQFDVEATMSSVVPEPHYEIAALGLAIDGREAVREMYRRLLAGNRNRNIQAAPRAHAAGQNTLLQEAHVTFDDAGGRRVSGLYVVVVQFDPARGQIIGERMYTDPHFTQMWRENLGEDFIDVPGVSVMGAAA